MRRFRRSVLSSSSPKSVVPGAQTSRLYIFDRCRNNRPIRVCFSLQIEDKRIPTWPNSRGRAILSRSSIPPLKSNALKEGFCGVLQLYAGLAHRDGFSMPINIPTGLHFTKPGHGWGGRKVFPRCFETGGSLCSHQLRFIPKGESVWRRHARSNHRSLRNTQR